VRTCSWVCTSMPGLMRSSTVGRRAPAATRRSIRSSSSSESTTMRPTPTSSARAARRGTCCCRAAPGGRPGTPRRARPRARRRSRRRGAAPRSAPGVPSPGTGTPWSRRSRRRLRTPRRASRHRRAQVRLVVDEQRRAVLAARSSRSTPPIDRRPVSLDGVGQLSGRQRRGEAGSSHPLRSVDAEQVRGRRAARAGGLHRATSAPGAGPRRCPARGSGSRGRSRARRRRAPAPRS
jgi:hypothetical protein